MRASMTYLAIILFFSNNVLGLAEKSNKDCPDYLSTNIPISMIKRCIYNDIVWFYKFEKDEKILPEEAFITINDIEEYTRIIPCGHIVEVPHQSDLFISPVFPYDTGLYNLYTDFDKIKIKTEVQRLSGGTFVIDHISNIIPKELCAFKIVGAKGSFKISKYRHRIKLDNSVKEKFSKPNIIEEEAIKSNYCPQKKNLSEKILFSSTTVVILTKNEKILVINGYRVIGKCDDDRLKEVEIGDLLISTDGERISYDSIFALKFCDRLNYTDWVFMKPVGSMYKVHMGK